MYLGVKFKCDVCMKFVCMCVREKVVYEVLELCVRCDCDALCVCGVCMCV